ncbi:MAG: hypothetical protein NWT04_03520 [Verrucomicrobiales bacterium]|nr:hypothetical protein [Verrucomicrobiales bacterium]
MHHKESRIIASGFARGPVEHALSDLVDRRILLICFGKAPGDILIPQPIGDTVRADQEPVAFLDRGL